VGLVVGLGAIGFLSQMDYGSLEEMLTLGVNGMRDIIVVPLLGRGMR
jgi:hypothetical protein